MNGRLERTNGWLLFPPDPAEGLGCNTQVGGNITQRNPPGDVWLPFEEQTVSLAGIIAQISITGVDLFQQRLLYRVIDGQLQRRVLPVQIHEGRPVYAQHFRIAGCLDRFVRHHLVNETVKNSAEAVFTDKVMCYFIAVFILCQYPEYALTYKEQLPADVC